jgi:hypothetical protein
MKRLAAFSSAVLLGSLTMGAQTPAPNPAPAPSPELVQPSGQAGKRVIKIDPAEQPGQQSSSASTTVYVVPTPSDSSCPVSMHAQHGSGGGMRFVRNGQSPAPSGVAQHIHLTMGTAREPARVAAARVTVHGTSAKWRTVPTAQMLDGPDAKSSDMRKTLNITFNSNSTASADESEGASTDMVLSGFTSVQSITLDSLTYTDGSIWTPAEGRTCRVVPDPLMLVDSQLVR